MGLEQNKIRPWEMKCDFEQFHIRKIWYKTKKMKQEKRNDSSGNQNNLNKII